jgi:hypothetical protein|tara:strand:- start:253 stop:414 length:162 start_codon:yes stop_codon:yes gene_type:complete
MKQVRLEALKLASRLEGVTADNVLAVSELLAQYISAGPKVVELDKLKRKHINK